MSGMQGNVLVIVSDQHSSKVLGCAAHARSDQAHNLAEHVDHAEVRKDLEEELAKIVDPIAVDVLAKSDQAAFIARFGGPEAAVALGTVGHNPPPEISTSDASRTSQIAQEAS